MGAGRESTSQGRQRDRRRTIAFGHKLLTALCIDFCTFSRVAHTPLDSFHWRGTFVLTLNLDHTRPSSLVTLTYTKELVIAPHSNFPPAGTCCCVASLNQLPMVTASCAYQLGRLHGLPSRRGPYGAAAEFSVGTRFVSCTDALAW